MPDFDAMRKAAGYFEGKHDFKAFTTAKKNKSTERTIKRKTFSMKEQELT